MRIEVESGEAVFLTRVYQSKSSIRRPQWFAQLQNPTGTTCRHQISNPDKMRSPPVLFVEALSIPKTPRRNRPVKLKAPFALLL